MLVEPLLEVGGGLEVEQGFAEVVELGGCGGVEAGGEGVGHGADAAAELAQDEAFFALRNALADTQCPAFLMPACCDFHCGLLFCRRELGDSTFVLIHFFCTQFQVAVYEAADELGTGGVEFQGRQKAQALGFDFGPVFDAHFHLCHQSTGNRVLLANEPTPRQAIELDHGVVEPQNGFLRECCHKTTGFGALRRIIRENDDRIDG